MKLTYTYWQESDGFYVGYLNIWPEHWTQGTSLEELEEMLRDLYAIYLEEHQANAAQERTGVLEVATA